MSSGGIVDERIGYNLLAVRTMCLRILFGCLLLGSQLLAGCTLLSPNQGAMSDYEFAKRSIDSPTEFGDYRPEGKSAERDTAVGSLMQKIGLQRSRRKNAELAKSQYAAAEQTFNAGRQTDGESRKQAFRDAAKQFEKAADNWPSSALEQDALLMAGEASFFAEDYYHAEDLYSRLSKEYPRNRYLDHVESRRFEIADYWLKLQEKTNKSFLQVNFTDSKEPWNDTGGHGKRVLESLRIDNPTGKLGDDATMRLAMDQYEAKQYEDAAQTFADLRMTYPDSEHLFNAQFLEMQSLLESYQGPSYSSVPLTDAMKRVKQIAQQFPSEAAEHQQDLNRAYARIRFSLAERVWNNAQYRLNRSEHGSAKFHLNNIIEEYGDTPFADRAREELARISDKPDDPPQHLGFLLKMFGDKSNERPWQKAN